MNWREIVILARTQSMKMNDYIMKADNASFYLPECKKDLIQREILFTRTYYDRNDLDEVFGELNSGLLSEGIVLDIGANIGNHALYFVKEQNAAQVYCFEPIKRTYDVLKKNVAINGLNDKIITYNVGVGEECGKGEIAKSWEDNWGGTQIKASASGDIDIIAIDDIDFDTKVVFVKVDVETYELHVIQGMVNTLKKYHPIIKIEIVDKNFEEVNKILMELGYVGEKRSSQEYLYRWHGSTEVV